MARPAIAFIAVFLCWNAYAACDVKRSDSETISLVVESSGCFRSHQQKQAFATQLKQAVQSMENDSSGLPQRKSSAEKLNGFGDLKRQAKQLSPAPPVYYGQR